MEAHDNRPPARKGGVTPEQRKMLDELAARVASLPADRRELLLQALEGAMLADDLRQAIANSGLTPYAIAKRAQVRPEMVTRFLSGERDLYLETAGKIAAVLGLALRPVGRVSAPDAGGAAPGIVGGVSPPPLAEPPEDAGTPPQGAARKRPTKKPTDK